MKTEMEWDDVVANQGTPADSRSEEKQGVNSPREPQEGGQPADTLIWG